MFLLKSLSELEKISHDEHDLGALVDDIAERVIECVDAMDPRENSPEQNDTAQREKSMEPEGVPGQFNEENRQEGSTQEG